MKYRDVEKRLAQLETGTTLADAGDAPKSWHTMTLWCFIVHDVGGWDEGWRRIRERGWYPENLPDNCKGNGTGAIAPQWDQDRFYQRGRNAPWFTNVQKYEVLWMIYQYVDYLLAQGVPRAEVVTWDVGVQCWDAIHDALTTNGDDHAND
jgi:hypothetical protein